MKTDPKILCELADAVLEGRELDWNKVETSANPEERSVILQFRTIAKIAGLSRKISETPRWWGHLRIDSLLGSGAFGHVYKAWDSRLERDVALKLLKNDRDPVAVLSEARMLARIRHPNIVTVFDVADFDGEAGFWMEFVEGETLELQVQRSGPLPVDEVLKLGIELCGALGAVHDAGLLHKDVKTQNVIRTVSGRVVLMDFGAGEQTVGQSSPHAVGTPLYLAPEVLAGGRATVRSEIYSLGVLLFRIATGAYPVSGNTIEDLLASATSRKKVMGELLQMPMGLAQTLARALDPNPAARFASAADMGTALAGLSPTVSPRLFLSVSPALRVAAGVIIVATLAIAGGMYRKAVSTDGTASLSVITDTAPSTLLPPVPSLLSAPVVSEASGPRNDEVQPAAGPPAVSLQSVDPGLRRRVQNFGGLANDGIHATCTPDGTVLAICNLQTGVVRELPARWPGGAMLSPDLSRVAYLADGNRALRIIDFDGRNDREAYRSPEGQAFGLSKWIRDGRAMLAVRGGAGGPSYFAITIADRSVKELWRSDQSLQWFDLSPDERFVVLSRPPQTGDSFDLAIIDTQTGRESWLVQHPSDDTRPVWAPNGRSVVFVSNRLGANAIFVAPVIDGRAAGEVTLLRDLGRSMIQTINAAGDGTLFLRLITHWSDSFQANIDLEKGVISTPVRIESSIEDTLSPDWSPDTRLFAYVSGPLGRSQSAYARVLLRHFDGRLFKEIPLNAPMSRAARLRWSPDGRHLAVRVGLDNASGALSLVDVETEAIRPFVSGLTGPFVWNADGTALYFKDLEGIQRREIATSEITTVVPGMAGLFDISRRDGSIALTRPIPGGCSLLVIAPGELPTQSSVRHSVQGNTNCTALAWSRDGLKLLLGTVTQPEPPAELWVVDVQGGDPRRIFVPAESMNSFSLSPDNHSLLFSAGNPLPEFWTLRGAMRQ